MADHNEHDRTSGSAGRSVPPVPPTPGFHPAPGKEPEAQSRTSIPATPGFHSAPAKDARSGQNAPTAPTPRQRSTQRGAHAAEPTPITGTQRPVTHASGPATPQTGRVPVTRQRSGGPAHAKPMPTPARGSSIPRTGEVPTTAASGRDGASTEQVTPVAPPTQQAAPKPAQAPITQSRRPLTPPAGSPQSSPKPVVDPRSHKPVEAKPGATTGVTPATKPVAKAPEAGVSTPEVAWKPIPKPQADAKSAPEPKPAPAAKPGSAAKPAPKPAPAAKPVPAAKPAPKPEPKPVPAAKPGPAAKPAPKPEPKPAPAAKPAAKPAPKPAAKPVPKPAEAAAATAPGAGAARRVLTKITRRVEEPKVPAYRPPEGDTVRRDDERTDAATQPLATSAPRAGSREVPAAAVAGEGVSLSSREDTKHASAASEAARDRQLNQAAPGAPEPADPAAGTRDRASSAQSSEHSGAAGGREARRVGSDKRPSVGVLFSQLSDQVQTLVKGEIALVKAKCQGLIAKIGTGAALLLVAAILALYLLGLLLHAAVLGLSHVMPDWAAALVVAAVLLVIIVVCALVGISLVKKGMNSAPNPQENLKKDVDAMKKGVRQ